MSSLFALPSVGGDLSRASQVPPSAGSSALLREPGLTLTCISVMAFSFIGYRMPTGAWDRRRGQGEYSRKGPSRALPAQHQDGLCHAH